MLRSQNQSNTSKGSQVSTTTAMASAKSIDVADLAKTLLPLLSQSIQDAVTTNFNDEFKKVNECIAVNLNKINDKSSLIGDRHERIESELAAISHTVTSLHAEQNNLSEKVVTFERTLNENKESVSQVQSTIHDLENEIVVLKKMTAKETIDKLVAEKLDEIMQQQQQTPQNSVQSSENPQILQVFDLDTECRLETIEQYNRRDCLLFGGLYESDFEDCTEKVIQTVNAMGLDISYSDISISHRLSTRHRRRDEPRPIIAKFTRRTVRNQVLTSKYRLKNSDNHYNVFVQEQLTRPRARALYKLKEEGFRVTTNECRLMYSSERNQGIINSLADLQSKLGWDLAKMKEVFGK